MIETCDIVRKKLAEEGPRVLLQGASAEEHLAACADCFAFFEELNRLDGALASLPERDAAEPVVAEVIASIGAESTRDNQSPEEQGARARKLEPLLAVASILVSLLAIWGFVAILPFGEVATEVPVTVLPSPVSAPAPDLSLPKRTPQPTESVPPKSARSVESRETPTSWIEERALLLPPEPDFSQPAADRLRAGRAASPAEVDASISFNEVRSVTGVIALAPGVSTSVANAQGSPPPKNEERLTIHGSLKTVDLEAMRAPVNAREPFNADPMTEKGPIHSSEIRGMAGAITLPRGVAADPQEIEERITIHAARETAQLESTHLSTSFSEAFVPGRQRKKPRRLEKARRKAGVVEPTPSGTDGEGLIADLPVQGRSYANVIATAKGSAVAQPEAKTHGGRTRDFSARVGRVRTDLPASSLDCIEEMEIITGGAVLEFGRASGGFARAQGGVNADADGTNAAARERARRFLERRAALEGVTFRSASGYWANTYVPGDPLLRLLGLRLAATNAPVPVAAERLHGAARPLMMPFDPPQHAAVGLHVAADRASVNERTRMLVQVGIQGKPVRGSRRPPMNVAVVLDLRGEVPPDVAASMRALVDALRRLRDPGDRFSLYVAGRPGGRIAGPDELRYGFLSVALGSLLGNEAASGPTLDVLDAFSAAHAELAGLDDPTRPIGSSAVLLVTGQGLGDAAKAMGALASERALDGVSSSALAVGARVDPTELEAIALAGQGSMRAIAAPAEALDVMARELSAVSRVVARAVRLSIRLAPGVELIDVLGSGWLDAAATENVLKTQVSIDRRTNEQMGIPRDRRPSDEDDGIQILIPNFHAGDSHTVLLDVVADGPGPIADVRVRFKDLVRLENGTARVSLDLPRGQREPGPLERLVLKNLLALELADSLERAGTSALAGARDQARATLARTALLLEGMRFEVPDLKTDPDLGADLAMLAAYGEALGQADDPAQLAWIGDSLRYAARLEVLPDSRVN